MNFTILNAWERTSWAIGPMEVRSIIIYVELPIGSPG